MSTTYEYECVNRIGTLKSSIEAITGETYADLTEAVQGLKDSGGNIEDFIKYQADLGDVTLSDNFDKLREGAFANCYVGNVTLPEGITEIPLYAFYDCIFRTNATVILPNSLRTIGRMSFYGANMNNITIPEGVTTINEGAFSCCAALTSITIPQSVATIEDDAFSVCPALSSAIINGTNLTIDNYAFGLCNKLSTVTFEGATPVSIYGNAFGSNSNLTTINVPWAEGAVEGAPWGATNATINYNYTEG